MPNDQKQLSAHESISGFRLSDDMWRWQPIVLEWFLLLERFAWLNDGHDAAYWYNERANVGVLAGAAWRAGLLALEEFSHEKKGVKNGRCDLWICHQNGDEEYIEAKHEYSLGSLSRAHAGAIECAKDTGSTGETGAVAVTFITPHSTNPINDEWIENQIQLTAKRHENCDFDVVAWMFPGISRNLQSTAGRYFPGVFLFAEWVE